MKNLCFFYVLFALLFRLLLDVRWTSRLLLTAFGIVAGLASSSSPPSGSSSTRPGGC